jgi:hypothetical protein
MFLSTSNHSYSWCQLNILLTVGINSILFWQVVSTAHYFDSMFNPTLFGQFVSTSYYFNSWYQRHIILKVCVYNILFWQLVLSTYIFDSWCQKHNIMTVCVNILYWQLLSMVHYFDSLSNSMFLWQYLSTAFYSTVCSAGYNMWLFESTVCFLWRFVSTAYDFYGLYQWHIILKVNSSVYRFLISILFLLFVKQYQYIIWESICQHYITLNIFFYRILLAPLCVISIIHTHYTGQSCQ